MSRKRSRAGRPGSPIMVRGRRFRSLTEAAREYDVSPSLIHYHHKKGSLDRVSRRTGRRGKIKIGDKEYESLKAVAVAYKIPYNRVYTAKRRGYLHKLSVGSNFKLIPTIWRGKKYESRVALAKHLGVSVNRVYHYASLGKLDELQSTS